MNISTQFLTKLIRRVAAPDPVTNWSVLLTMAGVALVGIIAWNVQVFQTVVNGGTIGAPAIESRAVPSDSSFNAVHTMYEQRDTEESKYKTGVYRYNDPSQ